MVSTQDKSGGGNTPISTKPYLIRAIYEWSIDNGFTPQILVSAESPGVILKNLTLLNFMAEE